MNKEIVNIIINKLFEYLYYDNNDFQFISLDDKNDFQLYKFRLNNYDIFNKKEQDYLLDHNLQEINVEYRVFNIMENDIPYTLISAIELYFVASKSFNIAENIFSILTSPSIELFNKLKNVKHILYLDNEFSKNIVEINKYLLFAFLKTLAVHNSKEDLIEHTTPVFKYLFNKDDEYLFYFYELENILPSNYFHFFKLVDKSFIKVSDLVKAYCNIKFNNDNKIMKIKNIKFDYDLVIDYNSSMFPYTYYFSTHVSELELDLTENDVEFLNKFKDSFILDL